MDATGGTTMVSPQSAQASVNGTTQCVVITQPTLPAGSVYWEVFRAWVSGTNNTGEVIDYQHSSCPAGSPYNNCTPVKYTTITDQVAWTNGSAPAANTSVQHVMYPTGSYGTFYAATENTEGQCFSSASPAVCGANIDGFVAIAAGASSVVVNTTAVTGNSEISLTFDTTQGANLGVTCNTSPQQPYISARTAGASFTISVPSNFSSNPGCIGFHIKN